MRDEYVANRVGNRLRGVLLGAVVIGLALPWIGVRADELLVAEIDRIEERGLYRQDFGLRAEAEVVVSAVGSGSRERDALLAYAWILDLQSRHVVWLMDATQASPANHEDNLRQEARLRLPSGVYALYFSAYGGIFPIRKAIKLLDLFELGAVSFKGGHMAGWNEVGNPSEWGVTVRLAEAGGAFSPLDPAPAVPALDGVVALNRLGNEQVVTARLDLDDSMRFRLLAVGEYSAGCHGFADAAWIQGYESCERVWEMTLPNTEPAGGATKNRVFDREVEFSPGSYLIHCATDDSHAYQAWNSRPPYDPEAWGLTLIPLEEPAPGSYRVTLKPDWEHRFVAINRVGDAEFHEQWFELTRTADIHVRAFGEWDDGANRYFDFGWIEDPYRLETLWTMNADPGIYAAGECRNRLVEDHVRLAPGTYRACYVTDEAHSYDGWHSHPPFEPDAWGIQLCGTGSDFDPSAVRRVDPARAAGPVRIALAPVRDGAQRSLRFRVEEPLSMHLIAVGEGEGGEMFDYGWLDRIDTGEVIWRMRYPDTHHAGGAEKNRRVERYLRLERGTYELHFVTDDSHAFGDWNEAVPDEPHLWGVTLIEIPSDESDGH